MKDIRFKELMEQVGMPDSQSLLIVLQQVANETAQEIHSEYKKIIVETLDSNTLGEAENILYAAL